MAKSLLTYYSHAWLTAPKIDIDFLWKLTLIFGGLATIYFLSVFIFRNSISSRSAKAKARKKELSPMISEFLFFEDDADKTEKSRYIDLKIQIRELLKNPFNRKVLTEILLDLRKDVSGDTRERLFKLYQDLGLEKDAFAKLDSRRWEVISKGISHLTQMHVESAYGFITKFINHRRGAIRKQAEIAIVTLKPEGIGYFLDTTRYKISEWQQLKLLDVMRNQEDLAPPRFKMWLTSTNKYVVLFALRLIKYYNQNDANMMLVELIKHKNDQIKEEAINCIKEFHVTEALPTLKQVYSKCKVGIKISILGAIGDLGTISEISFLRNVAQREGNFLVKSKALATINSIAPNTIMPTKGIEVTGSTLAPYSASNMGREILLDSTKEEQTDATAVVNENRNQVEAKQDAVKEQDIKESGNANESEGKMADGTLENANEIGLNFKVDVETVQDSDPHETWSKDDKENEEKTKEQAAEGTHSAHDTVSGELEENIVDEKTRPLDVNGGIETQHFPEMEEPVSHRPSTRSATNERDTQKNLRNTHDFYFDFLPFVIESESKPVRNLEKYEPMANTEKNASDPRNIEVDFEEVSSFNVHIDEESETENSDVPEIDFIPIVVDVEDNEEGDGHSCPIEKTTTLLNDIQVSYEEVQIESVEDGLFGDMEVDNLNFLPIVTDNEAKVEEKSEEIKPGNAIVLNELEGFTLSDFEVSFEETPMPANGENTSSDFEEPTSTDEEEAEVEDAITWLLTQNELREIELHYEVVSADNDTGELAEFIPEPVYYDEHEAYMMGLLDDLEELGDVREIPLLEELLAAEKKSFIKDRINHLIEQFSMQKDDSQTIEKNCDKVDLPMFSVFADLFKNIDTESKLILLDEIVVVGDEKEIAFLDGLLEDSNPDIRKKAQQALKQLAAKISETEKKESHKKKLEIEVMPTRLLDCEITPHDAEQGELTVEEEVANHHELEDQSHIDPEIFVIDFELSEVLDKTYDKKVLNLPIVATEVAPNGASLIFQSTTPFKDNTGKKRNG